MALRKEKLESIKKQLTTRRAFLAHDLRQATADLINDDPFHTDTLDQASADTDKSLTLQMKNRDRNVLWEIDEALRRIEDGSFGVCERCDESIADARMKANPATTLCIDCKAELESEQRRIPGRA
jgi:DnaK suppressor protein